MTAEVNQSETMSPDKRPILRVGIYDHYYNPIEALRIVSTIVAGLCGLFLEGYYFLQTDRFSWWIPVISFILMIISYPNLFKYQKRIWLYESGITIDERKWSLRRDGLAFYPWRELITIKLDRFSIPGERVQTTALQLVWVDGRIIDLISSKARVAFYYPQELNTKELSDNRVRLGVDAAFINMLYVFKRRAYKAKWTGNVDTSMWLA